MTQRIRADKQSVAHNAYQSIVSLLQTDAIILTFIDMEAHLHFVS